ncbi:MAG: hypothetical protein PHP50_07715 [Lachnospiraceae bacterium]|nr:hypothetical protein [Lachnospiraceae bacterium]
MMKKNVSKKWCKFLCGAISMTLVLGNCMVAFAEGDTIDISGSETPGEEGNGNEDAGEEGDGNEDAGEEGDGNEDAGEEGDENIVAVYAVGAAPASALAALALEPANVDEIEKVTQDIKTFQENTNVIKITDYVTKQMADPNSLISTYFEKLPKSTLDTNGANYASLLLEDEELKAIVGEDGEYNFSLKKDANGGFEVYWLNGEAITADNQDAKSVIRYKYNAETGTGEYAQGTVQVTSSEVDKADVKFIPAVPGVAKVVTGQAMPTDTENSIGNSQTEEEKAAFVGSTEYAVLNYMSTLTKDGSELNTLVKDLKAKEGVDSNSDLGKQIQTQVASALADQGVAADKILFRIYKTADGSYNLFCWYGDQADLASGESAVKGYVTKLSSTTVTDEGIDLTQLYQNDIKVKVSNRKPAKFEITEKPDEKVIVYKMDVKSFAGTEYEELNEAIGKLNTLYNEIETDGTSAEKQAVMEKYEAVQAKLTELKAQIEAANRELEEARRQQAALEEAQRQQGGNQDDGDDGAVILQQLLLYRTRSRHWKIKSQI